MHRCTKVPLLLSKIRKYTQDPDERHHLSETLEKLEESLSTYCTLATTTIARTFTHEYLHSHPAIAISSNILLCHLKVYVITSEYSCVVLLFGRMDIP